MFFGYGKSDVGLCRTNNEDSIFVSNNKIGRLDNLFIVADGLGGHSSGEVASRYAIKCFLDYVKFSTDEEPLDILVTATKYANFEVFKLANEREELKTMGTTFSALTIKDNRVFVVHIGDSRVYYINNKDIKQITKDHTFVMDLVRAGGISTVEAQDRKDKNILTRALGTEEFVKIDTCIFKIENTDKLVITSDGLTNMVSNNKIFDIIKNSEYKPAEKVELLIKSAINNGGIDNISIVIICES